jgi:hypothetical protein
MVFGFLKGKIELKLDKYNYSPGETVTGNLVLKMKKPVSAKKLEIQLIAVRKTSSYTNKGRRTNYRTIFDFKQPLDKEKTYSGEKTYPFKIKIPIDVIGKIPEGTLGRVVKVAAALSGRSSNIKWYLKGNLNISGILNDVNKKVQINVA